MLHHVILNCWPKSWKHPGLGMVIAMFSLTVFSQAPERALEEQVVQFSETTAIRSMDGGQTWQLAKGDLEDVPYWAEGWLKNKSIVDNSSWTPRSMALELQSGGVLRKTVGEDAWQLESSRLNAIPYWAQGWLENAPIERSTNQQRALVKSMCGGEKPQQRTQTVQIDRNLSIRSFDGGETWTMAEGLREDLPDWAEAWLNQPVVEVLPAKELTFDKALIRSVDGGQTWKLIEGEMEDLPGWVRPWVGGNYPMVPATGSARGAESAAPQGFSIYPNPAHNSASLRFELERAQEVQVLLYDLQGKLIREVQNGSFAAGTTEIQFSVADLAAGPYFLQFIAEDQRERIRLVRAH